jgi:hypothetical protein
VKDGVSVFEHDMQGNDLSDLGDNCIVFENFMTLIGDLEMDYWRCVSGTSKRIFVTIKSCVLPHY